MKACSSKRLHGFSLIDVSLGIVVGIGVLVSGVALFQHVSNTRFIAETAQAVFNLSSQVRTLSQNTAEISELPGFEVDDLYYLDLTGYGLGPGIAQNVSVFTDPSFQNFFFMRIDELQPRTCLRLMSGREALGSNIEGAECGRDNPVGLHDHLIITFRR